MLRNIASSAGSSLYTTFLSLAVVPILLGLVGDARYGLIGIFLLLTPVIALLDLGFGVASLRESSRAKAGAVSRVDYAHMMRGIEAVFLFLLVIMLVATIALAPIFAKHWLNLPVDMHFEVGIASMLMFASLLLRWLAIIYRSKLIGFEAIQWVAGFNTVLATFRFGGAVPLILMAGTDLRIFFAFQAVISLVEAVGFMLKARSTFSVSDIQFSLQRSLNGLGAVIGFTGAVSIGGLIWVAAAQLDKIIVMRLLSISDYGKFSIAVIVASGISMLAGPVNVSLLPALSRAVALNDMSEFRSLFQRFGQINAVILLPLAAMMAFFPNQILTVWTGRPDIGETWGPVLAVYAVANTMLAFSIFGHYGMIAMGRMKLYVFGIFAFSGFFVALLLELIGNRGALGAAYAWLAANFAYLFFWNLFVLRRLVPGLALPWITKDLLFIAAPSALVAWLAAHFAPFPEERWQALAALMFYGFMVLTVAVAASPICRKLLISTFIRRDATDA
jgi:O-antigen/teichoic acid export membrane protein